MRESKIEEYLKKEVGKYSGLCLKFTSSVSGVPDRIVILPENRIYFVELKQEKGRLSKLQKYMHRQFEKRGVPVYVPYSKNDVDKFINEVVKNGN
ncbi:VRR-NUC domain-containing protein [Staphylococcus saprophyticus]|nr:VRR-NUC domain-containing protein [Staphylococcus saprophyticus]